VFDPSPLGKKVGIASRAKELLRVFGPAYFLHYAARFAAARVRRSRRVSNILRQHGVRELRLEENVNAPSSIEAIRALRSDLLVSVAGNQIFRAALLAVAPKGCLNVHSALLPKYRGLMPIFWALKNGEKETGVSVFLVDEGIDSGPIVIQKRVPITTDRLEDLIRQTKVIGMDAVWEAVEKVRRGRLKLIPNPDNERTYFSFPPKADVRAFRAAGKRLY
jgi:methionyl-tRNA formyltransferase